MRSRESSRWMRRFAVMLLVAFFTFGVASVSDAKTLMDKIMNSWVGASLDDAFAQWGFPEEERKIAGKLIYIWLDSDGGIGNLANCERMLAVDKNNIVVAVDHKGINCPFMELGPYAKWRKR